MTEELVLSITGEEDTPMEIEMRCAAGGVRPRDSSEGQHPGEGARRDIPPREVGSSEEEEEDMIDPRGKRRQELERLMERREVDGERE